MEIYEDGREIGTLHIEKDGLYTRITCKTEPSREIRRVYLAYPFASEYIGIPDKNGELTTRIAQKHIPQSFCAVAATSPKSLWLPWRGEVDGVMIETALIAPKELAMPLAEAMKFPEWDMEIKEINHTQMAILPLDADGMPLPKEREDGANETMDINDFDFDVPIDELPDDGIGSEGWEVNCADL